MRTSCFNKYLFFVIFSFLVIGCDENKIEPFESNMTPPGKVSVVSVENLAGRSKIIYSLPNDQDLLYVKALYTLNSGQEVEVKTSYYENSLVVEGFGDTDEHIIKLYAVNRSETESEPVLVTIKPLENNIWEVFRSLEVKTAFGGLNIKAENEFRENIAVLVLEKNELNDWVINDNSIYTSTELISKSVRGLDTIPQDFGFLVRDRWLNTTDTLFATIKPLYEVALPKANYNGRDYPGDAPHFEALRRSGMWDGVTQGWPRCYLTLRTYTGDHTVTFDTGVLAKLSRIHIWDYPEYGTTWRYYYLGDMRKFEVWGSDTEPKDGSYDDWTLLGTFESIKPSGLPYGQQNNEDFQAGLAGFSYEFDVNAPKVRFLRIRCLENWFGTQSLAISEIQVYGDPK